MVASFCTAPAYRPPRAASVCSVWGEAATVTGTVGWAASVPTRPVNDVALARDGGATARAGSRWSAWMTTGEATGTTQAKSSGSVLFTAA